MRWFKRKDAVPASPLEFAVREALADVQAYARSHGGRLDLLEVTAEGDVIVKFRGACAGCPLSGITLKLGVEKQLREAVHGIRNVIAR